MRAGVASEQCQRCKIDFERVDGQPNCEYYRGNLRTL
jgi:hypothetical protein